MSECCGKEKAREKKPEPCPSGSSPCCSGGANASSEPDCPLTWFRNMVMNNLEHVKAERERGRKLVGIMCEYTPRELIMAAGAMPVCLCGGSAEMIPPGEQFLPSNLCPLIKSTFGYSVEKANPFLEMADLLVAETTCDGKKKMYELLAERHPMFVLELPQKPDDPHAFEHWRQELSKLRKHLEKTFGTRITDSSLKEAVRQMNRERGLKRKLADLMKDEQPPMTGMELLEMKSLISCIPADFTQYEKAIDMLPGRRLDPPAQERVRVLMTGVPLPHGAERVMEIVESHGGLVVCQETCTGVKPVLEDIDLSAKDTMKALAEKYYHLPCSIMTKNDARLESLRSLVQAYRPQCIIELTWHACLTYDVESSYIKKLAEQELGLPYLRIDTDYSPADSARIGLRVEALFETVKGR